ncbi:Atrial natriuretic peptide receptor A [Acromyrmex echinatior]|uniref:guanylate cyclase n=1 Tax=Acromyrmex echinatior TaxID=103372 RepID=F4W972_ACREC|nr:Atrial natriuretic peptide receptor A [Acromyrmex echinatior]
MTSACVNLQLQTVKQAAGCNGMMMRIMTTNRLSPECVQITDKKCLISVCEMNLYINGNYVDLSFKGAMRVKMRKQIGKSNIENAFLGPVCDYVIAPVARYAGVWGIPVLTAGAQAEAFRHKGQHYPTLTRMMGSHRLVGEALRHILRSFGWKICGLLFHNHEMASSKGNSECHFTLSAVYTALNQTPAHKSFNQETADTDEYKNLLSFIAKSARIYTCYPTLNKFPLTTLSLWMTHNWQKTDEKLSSALLLNKTTHIQAHCSNVENYGCSLRVHQSVQHNGSHSKLSVNFHELLFTFNLFKEIEKTLCQSDDWLKLYIFRQFEKREFEKNAFEVLLYNNFLLPIFCNLISDSWPIIVMCANSTTIREILLAAEQLGMVDSGEYVFFSIELSSSDNDSKEPWRVDGDTDERNEKARKAYQALLTVTARTPDNLEYLNFSREVKSLAQRKYNFIFGNSSVSTFVTAFYDAVLLYALALKESLPEKPGEVNLDGGNLTRRMWGKSFKGITGDVNIDENGDRIADYSLLDMDPETSRFEIVANYYGANKTLEYIPGKQIHWAGGRLEPPPDTPTCGFDGSLCPDNCEWPIYFKAGFMNCNMRFKLEAEIASMTWKVHWDDVIVIPNAKTRGSMYSLIVNKFRGSELTIYSEDNASLPDGVDRNVYVPTGFYKNSKVAIKLIPRNKVEISRPLLLELKRMKDLQHDHLVRFYGACLEPPHCCLLTEYCPKGSLQDILENEQIKLDRVFRGSLIHDIVRGMVYLHASEVKSHGNLKSSNCVVDSRFVLKIADFGLHELRRSVDVDSDGDKNSYAYWRKQLWTAPELLRMERQLPEGTQKGDVYSFAIIVHEIVMRQGPFYLGDNNEFPPKGES